jgi:hypothetical protein
MRELSSLSSSLQSYIYSNEVHTLHYDEQNPFFLCPTHSDDEQKKNCVGSPYVLSRDALLFIDFDPLQHPSFLTSHYQYSQPTRRPKKLR